jgi:CRISPR-associated protein Csm2
MNNPKVRFKNKGGGSSMGKSQYQNQSQKSPSITSILSIEDINKILNLNSETVGILIKKADELAKEIGDKIEGRRRIEQIPASKLRDFYDYAVQIKESSSEDDNWYLRLMLLKPKMTYHASKEREGSDKRKALELFNNEISRMLDKMDKNNNDHFKNFMTFFEAVVAYHKKYAKSN